MFPPPPNNGFGLLRGDFPGAEELRVIRSVKKVKFPARLPRFPAEGVGEIKLNIFLRKRFTEYPQHIPERFCR